MTHQINRSYPSFEQMLTTSEPEQAGPSELFLPTFLALEGQSGKPIFVKAEAIRAIYFAGESVVVQMDDEDQTFILSAESGTRVLAWAQSRAIVPGLSSCIGERK